MGRTIVEAAGRTTEQIKEDVICPNFMPNILVASTPERSDAERYVRLRSIRVAGKDFEESARTELATAAAEAALESLHATLLHVDFLGGAADERPQRSPKRCSRSQSRSKSQQRPLSGTRSRSVSRDTQVRFPAAGAGGGAAGGQTTWATRLRAASATAERVSSPRSMCMMLRDTQPLVLVFGNQMPESVKQHCCFTSVKIGSAGADFHHNVEARSPDQRALPSEPLDLVTTGGSETPSTTDAKCHRKDCTAERVSRPRYTVLIRPLSKVHVTDIPKQALTDAIEQSAPSAFIAEMAILRFNTTSNCIRITVRDEGHFCKLCSLSRLLATVNGNLRVFDVDTSSLQADVAGSSRGVIKIRGGLTIEYIKAHLRCQQATVTDVRMLGQTQLLLLTFHTERIPQRLVFEYEVIRVHEYRPRPVACYSCHRLGHVAKYCSFPPVCRDCGKPPHEVYPNCKQFPHCVACGASTHIALNPQCPQRDISKASPSSSAYVTPPAHSEALPTKHISWAQLAASSDFSQLIASLRQEIQELRKENQRLRDLVMTPKKRNRSLTPRRSRSRNELKSHSPTHRVIPVTEKDSAYSHETRGPCSLPGYRAFQAPTIKHKRQIPKGQAALLVRNDCPATQLDLPFLCSRNREIIAAKICPPGQQPFVAVSAYFRPGNTSVEPYTWLEKLKHTAQTFLCLLEVILMPTTPPGVFKGLINEEDIFTKPSNFPV
ncbi:hypothetical protein HPB49_013019 [Dermacentor silvarum]|uniref:Uncharacterized protein n=1 Tax=Dermacentor silvarum TaxID=543639 RepID=A0ACB8DJ17_DERSI|nr:hypothetical protein HPB49_013019 [Dermacentor silvarum]